MGTLTPSRISSLGAVNSVLGRSLTAAVMAGRHILPASPPPVPSSQVPLTGMRPRTVWVCSAQYSLAAVSTPIMAMPAISGV